MRTAVVLVAGASALAALTLLAPSSPSYDPFAWIVWGRELMPGAGGEPFALAGGPSWKPLPVLFTTPFALAGDAAPALWLLVARAGLLLAVAGAFALGRRLGGLLAGAVAALALLLLADIVSLAWRGASEPLLLAALLWAFERHLAGRRTPAFALGVAAALIRPELTLFLGAYALWRWRDAGTRERTVLVAGLAVVPLLWIGVPGLAGDPLAASSTAQTDVGAQAGPVTAVRRGVTLAVLPVWLLASAAVLLRRRDRAIALVGVGAVAWISLIAAMTAAGYAGVARYMLPAAALVSVLAGVGVAALLTHRRRLAVAMLLAFCAGFMAQQLTRLPGQVREGTAVARATEQLRAAVAAAGGAERLRRCALHGWVAVNHTMQSALAWEVRADLGHVARTMSRPGLLVRAPRSAAAGAPPAIAMTPAPRADVVARSGDWRVLAVHARDASFPRACDAREASGPARRIPNI